MARPMRSMAFRMPSMRLWMSSHRFPSPIDRAERAIDGTLSSTYDSPDSIVGIPGSITGLQPYGKRSVTTTGK